MAGGKASEAYGSEVYREYAAATVGKDNAAYGRFPTAA